MRDLERLYALMLAGPLLGEAISMHVAMHSVPNPLHVLQQNLLAAAVIEFRGSAVGVARNPLRGFKGAVIFEKIRDAGRPE